MSIELTGFGGMCHEAATLEAGLLEKPRQGTAMVQMETARKCLNFVVTGASGFYLLRDEKQVNFV